MSTGNHSRPPPIPRSTASPAAANLATYIALVLLLALGLGLIGLIAAVNPFILGVFLILLFFVGTISLNYLLWGWRAPPRDEEEGE